MKYKILFLIAASLLVFASCKDSDDGIEPEKPKAPESLVGDYFLSGTINNGNQNTTVIDDMESYISFNDDYTGTLFDAGKSGSNKFMWDGTKESLTANIDGDQILKIEDKEYKNIPYSKLIVKRTIENVSYDYIYIKANKTEASAEWKRFTQYDVVDKTVAAMNNAGMVAEVQTMEGRTDLLFNYGRKLNNGSMDWFIVEDFGQGKNPSVSLTNDDKVIVLFTPHDKEEGISCRVGDYNKNTRMMTWKAVAELDPKGKNPSVSLGGASAKAGTYPSVIMAYEGETGNIVSRIGLIDLYFPQARSLTAPVEVASTGKNPSIAIASEYIDATAAIAYETDNNNISYAVGTGNIEGSSKSKITWGTVKSFGEGVSPVISINNRDEVILSYKAPELPILMYSLGKLKMSDNSISFTKEDQYGAGSRYSISLNNMGDVLEVRRNKGMQWYYSSNLTGQVRNWMSKIDDNTLLSKLTIPGTHDSAARYGSGPYRCQYMSVNEQLYAGVRFFDIRLIYENGELMAYHGETSSGKQYITLAEICQNMIDFTKAYPGESFILSIKNEKPYKDANEMQAFNKAVKDQVELQSHKWYTEETVKGLKLGVVRDKMILLRRYDATEKFATDVTTWRDDRSFTISDYIHVQDEYNVNAAGVAGEKWPLVENMLKGAPDGKEDEYYINFTSGTGGITPNPVQVAQGNGGTIPKGINVFLGDYLNANKSKKRLGIVVMDFPTYEIIDNLIESN